jgi:CheY-like chemotaxis protein
MDKLTKKILIAEDSIQWQKFHVELLNSYESKYVISFDIASSARDALALVEENFDNPYDLIFSDLQMENDFHPDFAGEWLIKNIKQYKIYQQKPIVIVSAAYNISFIATTLGVDFLSKRSLISNPQAYFFKLDEVFL